MSRASQEKRGLPGHVADDVDVGEPRAIAIDLAPLLQPHKKHGKLSLRVERLPQQTKLSRGTRNSDGSWSLTRDELDDLEFLVPDGVEATKLSVRIISLAGGSTLAVVEYPLPRGDAAPVAAAKPVAAAMAASPHVADTQVELLRDELAKLKASLAERDAALAAAREAKSSAPSREAIDAAVAKARKECMAESDERLAAVVAKAASQLDQSRREWEGEQNERVAAAREGWAREAQDALARAKSEWKIEEVARVAALEAEWQARAAKAVAEAQAVQGNASASELVPLREKASALEAQLAARDKADAEQRNVHAAELRAVQDKLTAAQAALEERGAALALGEQARARLEREGRDALAKAEAQWKSDEASRFTAAEARWRDEIAKASQALAGSEAAQVSELRGKLAAAQAALTDKHQAFERLERDAKDAFGQAEAQWKAAEADRLAAAAARWRADAAKAGEAGGDGAQVAELRSQLIAAQSDLERADRETKDALAKAEAQWKVDEAVRFTAFEAEWRDRIAKAEAAADVQQSGTEQHHSDRRDAEIAELKATIETLRTERASKASAAPASGDAELRGLREKAAALEAKLIKANKSADEERLRWQREAQASISKAEKEFRAKETARRFASEAAVRKESADALAMATSRYEAAEAALAQVRVRSGKDDSVRVELELAATRSALATREEELTHLRAQLDAYAAASDTPVAAVAARPAAQRYVRDAIVAAAIGVAVVISYPIVSSLLQAPPAPPAPVVKKVEPPPPPPPAAPRTGRVSEDAKLRGGPSKSTGVVATLARGTSVVVLDDRTDWVLVRIEGAGAKAGAREGWVAAALLKLDPPVPPAR